MRIIAGTYGGRVLKAPADSSIRPTSDKVRGAVFNTLQARGGIIGKVVLDICCGSGAMGIEALSRGAAYCTFIDTSEKALNLARQNTEILGIQNADFYKFDARSLPANPAPQNVANLVFCDPPYDQNISQAVLDSLDAGNWIRPGCEIVLESAAREGALFVPDKYYEKSSKRYGDTLISYLCKKASIDQSQKGRP